MGAAVETLIADEVAVDVVVASEPEAAVEASVGATVETTDVTAVEEPEDAVVVEASVVVVKGGGGGGVVGPWCGGGCGT